jgi:hypothetical protein
MVQAALSWYLKLTCIQMTMLKGVSGEIGRFYRAVWCGLVLPQRFFYKLRDMNSVFSLSLWVSFTLSDEVSLLSGALNSVSQEWPRCLFRATRCRSHRGDRTLQVAQVSGAIQIHREAICIPLSPVMFTHNWDLQRWGGHWWVVAWPSTLLQISGRLGLCYLHMSPYQFLMKGAIDPTQAGHNHLGRKVMCLLGLWEKSKVQGNVLAKSLPALVPYSLLPCAFRQKYCQCYWLVDLIIQQAPWCVQFPTFGWL